MIFIKNWMPTHKFFNFFMGKYIYVLKSRHSSGKSRAHYLFTIYRNSQQNQVKKIIALNPPTSIYLLPAEGQPLDQGC